MHSAQAVSWSRWGLRALGAAAALLGIALVPQLSRDLALLGDDAAMALRRFVLDAATCVLAILLAVRVLQGATVVGKAGTGNAAARAAQVGSLLVGAFGLQALLAGNWMGLFGVAAAGLGVVAAGTWLGGRPGREARAWLWSILAVAAQTVAAFSGTPTLAEFVFPPHPTALFLLSGALLVYAVLYASQGRNLARVVAGLGVVVAAIPAAGHGVNLLADTPWDALGALPAETTIELVLAALGWTALLAAAFLGIAASIRVIAEELPLLYGGDVTRLRPGHCPACGTATLPGAAYCQGCGNPANT